MQVEQYYQQLQKPLLTENSSTVAFSENDKDERYKKIENIRTEVVKVNPSHLMMRGAATAGGGQLAPKCISMERTILMRAAQLQLKHLEEKFAADPSAGGGGALHQSARPTSCVAEMVRMQDFNDYVWATVSANWSIGDATYRVHTLYSLTFSHIEHRKDSVDKKEKQQFSAAASKEKKNPNRPRASTAAAAAASESKKSKKQGKSRSSSIVGNKKKTTVSGPGPSKIIMERRDEDDRRAASGGGPAAAAAPPPLSREQSRKAVMEYEKKAGITDSNLLLVMGDAFDASGRIFGIA